MITPRMAIESESQNCLSERLRSFLFSLERLSLTDFVQHIRLILRDSIDLRFSSIA